MSYSQFGKITTIQVDTNTLKVTAARLETIATHYNKLRSRIRPHEEQLFTAKIAQIETLLRQGIC